MLESMTVTLLVGTALGFLSGLGIGGGSLLILWLTMVIGVDPAAARGINLLFFLPSALIACFFRIRQGTLKLRPVLPAVIAGCIAAAASSALSVILDTSLLRRLLGALLITAGIRELFYRKR